jgi:ankyrin repeat protein
MTWLTEINPAYRKCLLRLFEISPPFTIVDDQLDLCISKPSAEVQNAYNDWLESKSSCIVLTSGDRGVGKSLNARALFRKLKRPSQLVTYFAFAKDSAWSQNSLADFLAAVSFQILNQDPERFTRVEDLCESMQALDAWTESGLLVLFQSLLDTTKGLAPLHIIIDDLHNCDSIRKLVGMLTAAVSNESLLSKLKVALFYTLPTTDVHSIEGMLQSLGKRLMYGPVLTTDTLKLSTATLSDRVVTDRPYLLDLNLKVAEVLNNCKNTTELLVAVQSLDTRQAGAGPRTLESLELLLSNPQPPLSDVIRSVFEDLPGWGRVTLGWIAHSMRPLRMNELAIAVALTDERASFSYNFSPRRLPIDFVADIKSLFGPLVRFEGGGIIFTDRVVRDQFIDLITAERKLGPTINGLPKNIIPSNAEITRILFAYISWKDSVTPVNEALQASPDEFIQPQGELFDLMNYTIRFLPLHYREGLNTELPELIQNRESVLVWPKINSKLNMATSPAHLCVADPLLLAAQFGLKGAINALGKNSMALHRETAISVASWAGHVDIVHELLVGECANRTETVDTAEALQYAAARGHDQVVNEIVGYMKSNAPENLHSLLPRLLCRAAQLGYEEQASMWITLGANVNAADDKMTALQHAARNGHASLVREFLEVKITDVKSDICTPADKPTDVPLILAASKGYELVVQHLLAAQADIGCLTKDGTNRTPLYLAASFGHETIVRCLLDSKKLDDIVLNRRDSSGKSPLIIACEEGNIPIVKLLLNKGASLYLDCRGKTALDDLLRLHERELALKALESARLPGPFHHRDICGVFLLAAKLGFEAIVHYCLESVEEEHKTLLVEDKDQEKENRTALHHASANGHISLVKLLLQSNLDVDPKDTAGLTPLVLAAEAGETEIVKLLLAKDANVFPQLPGDQTILSRVASKSKDSTRHAAVVSILLERTNIDPNAIDKNDRAALHWAAALGKFEITKALLRGPRAVDPEITDKFSWNALHYLAQEAPKSTKKIAKLLIRAGTDPFGREIDDWLPFHVAARHGNILLLELLWELDANFLEARAADERRPLHFSLESSMLDSVEWLMEHDADGNAKGPGGHTSLMMAAGQGFREAVRTLLDYSCDVKAEAEDGKTALHFAAGRGEVSIGKNLLEKEETILFSRDENNISALHYAILNQRTAFAAMLLDEFYSRKDEEALLSEDLNALITEDGDTPLILAIKTNQDSIVPKLLKLGAFTEGRDRMGSTALLAAVERPNGDLKILQALLDSHTPHVDVNAGGDKYPTALHNAARDGKIEVVKELIRLGAQVNKQGGEYNTALSAAIANGYSSLAIYLLELNEQKVDPNLPAGNFANSLSAALHSQSYDLIDRLLKADVDVNATDIQGRSAFHIGAQLCSWMRLENLRNHPGANPGMKDTQGRTIFHHAAMSGSYSHFTEILLREQGWEDLEVEDIDGWTPLHWACRHDDNVKIVEILDMLGAKLTRPTKDNWTPEIIAITHEADKVVDLIRTKLEENPAESKGMTKSRWKVGYVHPGVSCDGCFLNVSEMHILI